MTNNNLNSIFELLKVYLDKYSFNLDNDKVKLLCRHYKHIIDYQNKNSINLTRITEPKDYILKNIIDSLLFGYLIQQTANDKKIKILDIGTGGGYPGIELSIIFKDIDFYLLDSIGKKCTYLNSCINDLGLKNVQVINSRAELIATDSTYRETFDYITARAVDKIKFLAELANPLLRINGQLIISKGQRFHEELEDATAILNYLNMLVKTKKIYCIAEQTRCLLGISKNKPSPDFLPRRPGIYKKRPLKKS